MSKAYRRWKNAIKEHRKIPIAWTKDKTDGIESFRTMDLSMRRYLAHKKAFNRDFRYLVKKKRNFFSRPKNVELWKWKEAVRRQTMHRPEEERNDSN